jgi:hypothetical protein
MVGDPKIAVDLRNNLNAGNGLGTGLHWNIATGILNDQPQDGIVNFVYAPLTEAQNANFANLKPEDLEKVLPPGVKYDAKDHNLYINPNDVVGRGATPDTNAIANIKDQFLGYETNIQNALQGKSIDEPDLPMDLRQNIYQTVEDRMNKAGYHPDKPESSLQWKVENGNLVATISQEQASNLAAYLNFNKYNTQDLLPSGWVIDGDKIVIPDYQHLAGTMPEIKFGSRIQNPNDPDVIKGVGTRNEVVNNYLNHLPILEAAMSGDMLGAASKQTTLENELKGNFLGSHSAPIFMSEMIENPQNPGHYTYAQVLDSGHGMYSLQFVVDNKTVVTYLDYNSPQKILDELKKSPADIEKDARAQVEKNAHMQMRGTELGMNEPATQQNSTTPPAANAPTTEEHPFAALLANNGFEKSGAYAYADHGKNGSSVNLQNGGAKPAAPEAGVGVA